MKKNECLNCGATMKSCKGKLNCPSCRLHIDISSKYPTMSLDILNSTAKLSWQVVFNSKIGKESDSLEIRVNTSGKSFDYLPANGISFINNQEVIDLVNEKVSELLSTL